MAVATMKVPTIFYAVDRFSDVVSKMTRKTAAFGKTAQAAAMRTSRTLNSAGTSMLTAGAGIAVGLVYAVNEAVKFEKAMGNVSTTIDNTNPQMMKQMGEEVLAMAKRIPKPISELTDALYDVYSAGIDGKYAMTVLNQSGRLAVAGLGTTKEGVDIITSSLNAFNMSGAESENIAKMVFKAVKYGKTTVSQLAESFGSSAALVKNSNVSLAEYLATTAVLTTTGMTASRAQTQVASAITALIKPSGTMAKIFSRLGVKDVPKWIKANGGLVNSMRIVRDEADKMGVLTSKSFGRKEGFSAMLSLLGPLNSQYTKVMNDMTYGTDTLTEAFENQQKTTAAEFQRMKNSVTILAIKIGDELLPRINGFIDRLTPTIDGITSWMKENDGLATTLLNVSLTLLALGTAAKVGAFLFYGLSKSIAVVSALTKAYTFISTLAALANVSLGTAIGTAIWSFLLAAASILAIVAALGLLAYTMYKSGQTTKAFAQDKTTHFKIVSGQYETMEQRIARSNERIIANMKKLKMDLESVEKTGKTTAEIAQEKIANLAKEAERKRFKHTPAIAAAKSSTNVAITRFLGVRGVREVSEGELSVYSNVVNTQHKNLAGTVNPMANELINKIEVVIKDSGNNAESVKVNGENYIGGIPARTTSTKKPVNPNEH